jgi:hypothetical protein
MLERRHSAIRPEPSAEPVPASSPVDAAPSSSLALVPAVPDGQDGEASQSPALVDYARRVADEHHTKHGKPITRDVLRARLGVSNQLASDLLRTLRTTSETA